MQIGISTRCSDIWACASYSEAACPRGREQCRLEVRDATVQETLTRRPLDAEDFVIGGFRSWH
jgi:hypothetical protein